MPGRARGGVALVAAATLGPACQETTTEPTAPLAIQCSAVPAAGPAPLDVGFALSIQNALAGVTVAVSYGDGTQGSDPDVRHVYSAAGEYAASITVTSGGQTARCAIPISVAPAPAPQPTPRAKNEPPDAVFRTTPATASGVLTGTAPFRVNYNMCTTVDPDGDRLLFRMDLDGDGAFEYRGSSGADCRHEATYAVGTRTTTLCVADVDCPSWPLCEDYQPLHSFQCRSYTVTAVP
jgi:hypothetical protein